MIGRVVALLVCARQPVFPCVLFRHRTQSARFTRTTGSSPKSLPPNARHLVLEPVKDRPAFSHASGCRRGATPHSKPHRLSDFRILEGLPLWRFWLHPAQVCTLSGTRTRTQPYGPALPLCYESMWRREWDSNPRTVLPASGFQDQRLKPTQPSRH